VLRYWRPRPLRLVVAAEVVVAAERISVVPALVVAEWVQGALAGVAEVPVTGAAVVTGAVVTGAVVTGAVVTGAVVIGAVVIGVAATGVVVTGTAAIGVITSSSSATSAFPTGGGGGGATRTDTTVTVTPTITMATTAMDMVGATEMITISPVTGNTAIAADQGSLNCSGGSLALAIIAALLTGSWDPRRGERFELTSSIMGM
jgi:hypothetical protein